MSFLGAFSLLLFPHPSRFLFSSFSSSCVSFPFYLFSPLFFPPIWKSLFLAWNWLPYIGSQNTTLCQEFSWLQWSTKVREVYFQEHTFSSSSSLHVACVWSIASTSVQQVHSDSRTEPHVVLCCMLKPQQIPGFLAAFFLWFLIVSAAEEEKSFSESLLAVTFFNYSQLHRAASLGFGLSREWPLCIEVNVQY